LNKRINTESDSRVTRMDVRVDEEVNHPCRKYQIRYCCSDEEERVGGVKWSGFEIKLLCR